jgi:hypothetical protein
MLQTVDIRHTHEGEISKGILSWSRNHLFQLRRIGLEAEDLFSITWTNILTRRGFNHFDWSKSTPSRLGSLCAHRAYLSEVEKKFTFQNCCNTDRFEWAACKRPILLVSLDAPIDGVSETKTFLDLLGGDYVDYKVGIKNLYHAIPLSKTPYEISDNYKLTWRQLFKLVLKYGADQDSSKEIGALITVEGTAYPRTLSPSRTLQLISELKVYLYDIVGNN